MAYRQDEENACSEFVPLDPAITALVQQLAGYGLLMSEVRNIIKRTLEDKLSEVKVVIDGYDESSISILKGLPPSSARRH
jgi:hypothetical protein